MISKVKPYNKSSYELLKNLGHPTKVFQYPSYIRNKSGYRNRLITDLANMHAYLATNLTQYFKESIRLGIECHKFADPETKIISKRNVPKELRHEILFFDDIMKRFMNKGVKILKRLRELPENQGVEIDPITKESIQKTRDMICKLLSMQIAFQRVLQMENSQLNVDFIKPW